MRTIKSLIGLAAVLALPALGATPAFAADLCPPGNPNPAYCAYVPAPTVVTGPAVNPSSSGAILTGTINPHGTSARYAFQYGTTTAYGLTTAIASIAATSSTVPVAAAVAGLAPSTVYHYRLIAVNNGGHFGVGADATFSTLAKVTSKLKTKLTLKAKPKRDKTLPFKYTFSGTVKIPSGVSKAAVCGGKVKLTLKKGSKTVAKGTATVSTSCKYKKKITIKSTARTGKKKGTLKVSARYGGNAFLKSSKKSTKVKFF